LVKIRSLPYQYQGKEPFLRPSTKALEYPQPPVTPARIKKLIENNPRSQK